MDLSPKQKYDQTKYDQVKFNMVKNVKDLIKRYGPDAEKVIHGRALKTAIKSKEMKENRIKEMIYQVLGEKKKFPDLTGDGKVTKADILKGRGVDLDEDLDLGHQDNEPHMLKADLYKIGKYAMELYQMVDKFEGQGEVDFPHWWQAKIIKASSMISSAKHYLEFELKEPQVDAVVSVVNSEDMIDEKKSTKIEEESGNKMDWKKMGFKSEKEYNDFLKSKMDSLLGKIKSDPKLLNVFKRLKDR
jgi:hypothetical protein